MLVLDRRLGVDTAPPMREADNVKGWADVI
jgi:hypothetical protein